MVLYPEYQSDWSILIHIDPCWSYLKHCNGHHMSHWYWSLRSHGPFADVPKVPRVGRRCPQVDTSGSTCWNWAWILVSEHIIAYNPWWNPWWNDVIDGLGRYFYLGAIQHHSSAPNRWFFYSCGMFYDMIFTYFYMASCTLHRWHNGLLYRMICWSSSLSEDYGTARSNRMKYSFIKLLACFIYTYISLISISTIARITKPDIRIVLTIAHIYAADLWRHGHVEL